MSHSVKMETDGTAKGFVIADSELNFKITMFSVKKRFRSEKVQLIGLDDVSWSLIVRRDTSNGNTYFDITIDGFEPNKYIRYKLDIYCYPSYSCGNKIYSSKIFLPLTTEISCYVAQTKEISWSSDWITFIVHLMIDCVSAPVYRSKFHSQALAFKALSKVGSIALTDTTFSDFTFIVQGKEFKLHKNNLAAASPIMRKLFTADFREAEANKCIIDHVEPDIFEHLVRFIYSAVIPENIQKVAKPLYAIAHYYEVETLKEICEKEIHETLSVANAYDTFVWAQPFDLESLKFDSWQIFRREKLKIFVPLGGKEPPPLSEVLKLLKLEDQKKEILEKMKNFNV